MPQASAAARADLVDAALNPRFNSPVAGAQVITISLTFDTGRSPNLGGLWDALITLYGAAKVTNENDRNAAPGGYRWRVAA